MILIYFIAALALAGLTMRQKEQKRIHLPAAIFIGIQFIFLLYTALNKDTTDATFFTYDALGLLFYGVLTLLASTTLYYSIAYLDEESLSQRRIYYLSFILLCASITGAYFSNNVTLSWILIEATTLSSALLIYHRRTARALEAAWKYVLICSIGIALAYLGILFLSIMLKGQHELNLSYSSLRQVVQTANPLHLKIAFLLIFIGYSAKMEVFPLYSIGIDANHAVPTPMSGFLSTALVNLGFISIFRIYAIISVSEIAVWAQHVLLLSGIISVLVASVYMFQVRHYKRLFAYSTVENMGLVLIALSLGQAGCFIAIFHTLMHSFIKSTSFYSLSRIGKIYGSYQIDNIGSYFKVNPTGAIALILCLVALIAVPPSPLFVSELAIFSYIILAKKWIVFALLIFFLCFILYSLLTRLLHVCYAPLPDCLSAYNINASEKQKSYLQYVLLAIAFYFGITQPQWLVNLITEILSTF